MLICSPIGSMLQCSRPDISIFAGKVGTIARRRAFAGLEFIRQPVEDEILDRQICFS
jgi:hypothetical protein